MSGLAQSDADFRVDCVGIGVGPSNLSLSCLMKPLAHLRHVLLEKRSNCAWHDGLLVDGATLQVSFLKDLVTLADPTSPFSFISFLKRQGRLYHYINASFAATQRIEWNQYIRWACEELGTARFSDPVREVRFDGDFIVRTDEEVYRARHIVLGTGLTPMAPAVARPHLGPTVVHASNYLQVRHMIAGRRVAIVGGGQSGAEVLLNMLEAPEHEQARSCCWISRRAGYLPLDASPFTNELFTPHYSEYFFSLPPEVRQSIVAEQKLASDGISHDTLTRIYQALYVWRNLRQKQAETPILKPGRELTAMSRAGTGWRLTLRHDDSDAVETLSADVVILATGYEFAFPEYLDPIKGRIEMAGEEPRLGADYRVLWNGPSSHRIYAQNAARSQRGIADPNLSLLAWRSAKIINSIAGRQVYDLADASPFIDWSASDRAAAELCL